MNILHIFNLYQLAIELQKDKTITQKTLYPRLNLFNKGLFSQLNNDSLLALKKFILLQTKAICTKIDAIIEERSKPVEEKESAS